jgi:hypothetical protein
MNLNKQNAYNGFDYIHMAQDGVQWCSSADSQTLRFAGHTEGETITLNVHAKSFVKIFIHPSSSVMQWPIFSIF